MKIRLFAPLLLALLCSALPAYAIVGKIPHKADVEPPPAGPAFACSPGGFTLLKEETGLHLKGSITVPTAGYTSSIDEEEPGPDGSLHATLHLKKPGGAAAQVVSQVPVDHVFQGEGDRLTVMIDKPYPAGEDRIECKLTGSVQ